MYCGPCMLLASVVERERGVLKLRFEYHSSTESARCESDDRLIVLVDSGYFTGDSASA